MNSLLGGIGLNLVDVEVVDDIGDVGNVGILCGVRLNAEHFLLGFLLILIDGGNVFRLVLYPSVDHGLRLIFMLLDCLVVMSAQ